MEKKLRKSKIVTLLYVFATLSLIYACYQIGSTIAYVNSYYSAYGMTANVGETVGYVLQQVFQPLVMSILIFAAAKILNEVRALNPKYYATDEEIALEKEQKKLAKTAKDEAKSEEAAEPIVFEEKKDEATEEAKEEEAKEEEAKEEEK